MQGHKSEKQALFVCVCVCVSLLNPELGKKETKITPKLAMGMEKMKLWHVDGNIKSAVKYFTGM